MHNKITIRSEQYFIVSDPLHHVVAIGQQDGYRYWGRVGYWGYGLSVNSVLTAVLPVLKNDPSLFRVSTMRTVARSLIAQQCHVIMVDRDVSSMLSTNDATVVACDVSDAEQVRHVFQQNAPKSPTILVNCAGTTRDGWITNMSVEDWDSVMDVNLKGTFLTCREFLRLQNEKLKHGNVASQACSIVNVGSVVSEFGNLGQANYAASKGGVLGLTRALAKEAVRSNVRVNAVIPGFIETPMAEQVPIHVKEQIMTKIPMGRFGQPEEVAELISFLASPRSSYITGECIKVSGMIAL